MSHIHESRFVITFWTILGVTEILCSFRLILEGKAGKELHEFSRLEFLEKSLANNFASSDAEENTSRPLNRGGIADLCKSREPRFWDVMDSFALLAYACLAALRTLLQRLLACLNFILDSEDLFCWYKQQKKKISMNYGCSTSSWKPWGWVRLDLIFMMRDVYINFNLNLLSKLTSSRGILKSTVLSRTEIKSSFLTLFSTLLPLRECSISIVFFLTVQNYYNVSNSYFQCIILINCFCERLIFFVLTWFIQLIQVWIWIWC